MVESEEVLPVDASLLALFCLLEEGQCHISEKEIGDIRGGVAAEEGGELQQLYQLVEIEEAVVVFVELIEASKHRILFFVAGVRFLALKKSLAVDLGLSGGSDLFEFFGGAGSHVSFLNKIW